MTVLCMETAGQPWLVTLTESETECKNQKPLDTHYHRLTKLREGNVFTGVCHSVLGSEVITNIPSSHPGGRVYPGGWYVQGGGYVQRGHGTRGDTRPEGMGTKRNQYIAKFPIVIVRKSR